MDTLFKCIKSLNYVGRRRLHKQEMEWQLENVRITLVATSFSLLFFCLKQHFLYTAS